MSTDLSFGSIGQPAGGGLPTGVQGDMLRHNGSAYASLAMLTDYDWFNNASVPFALLGTFGADATNESGVRQFGLIQSASSGGSTAEANDAEGFFETYTTGTVIGNLAFQQYASTFQRRFDARRITKFSLPSVADIRMRVATADQNNNVVFGNDDPSANMVSLRFSTNIPDTNFMFEVQDGSTLNEEDTGVAADTAVHYFVYEVDNSVPEVREILLDANFAEQAIHTFTANLPGETTTARSMHGLATLASSAKVFRHYFTAIQNHWKGP